MACSNIAKAINVGCEGSVGGIRVVYLADWDKTKMTVNEKGEATFTGETAITWYEFKFRKNTSSLSSTLNVADDGSAMVASDLLMSFSRMDTEKRASINALTYAETMAVAIDSNGTGFFLGAQNPLYTSAGEGMTGQNRTDSNHYSITLHDDSTDYPLTVDATSLAAIEKNATKANA